MSQDKQTAGETAMQVYTWNELNVNVRGFIIDGNPWLVAKDLCDYLELSDVSKSLERLDDDEKLTRKLFVSGQERSMWLVNESGTYALILRSNKPKAREFRKWITNEVLPSIRKTGRYEMRRRGGFMGPRQGEYLDLRCEPYDTKWLGTTTVRVVEHDDVEWYSVADINRAMQVGTDAMQSVHNLREANPNIVRKIFIFGNTHPAWFTTITGLRLLVSGSRKLKSRSQMLQLQEGGAR